MWDEDVGDTSESDEENGFVDTEERVHARSHDCCWRVLWRSAMMQKFLILKKRKHLTIFTSSGCGCKKGSIKLPCLIIITSEVFKILVWSLPVMS